MYKLKIQMNFGSFENDDPTARGLSNQIVEALRAVLKQIDTGRIAVEVEKVTCVSEQRKDGRNILAV